MAQLGAVHGFGESVVRYLRRRLQLARDIEAAVPETERVLPECQFDQISGAQLATDFAPSSNFVGLYLYRIALDKTLRTQEDGRHLGDARSRPLSLELHYLLTVWATEAEHEQTLFTWTMRELHMRPLFDRSVLAPFRHWREEEAVQIVPSEIKHEDLMRIWDAIAPTYRLSTSYIARVVRVDRDVNVTAGPVVASRFRFTRRAEDIDA
jgi:hypothetical protein